MFFLLGVKNDRIARLISSLGGATSPETDPAKNHENKSPAWYIPGPGKLNLQGENLRFLFCGRCHRNLNTFHSLQARGFAFEPAQVIQLRAAHTALAQYLDRTDRRRIRREDAFDADAETYPAYCETCSGGLPALLDHHALERLDAFLFAFGLFQPHVDAHRIPRPQRRPIFP